MTNPGTVLLTLGRLPVALELARAFRACGWRVVVAEPFRWHMARLSRDVSRSFRVVAPDVDPDAYIQQLCDVVSRETVSLVVPVSEEVLYVSRLKEHLPASLPVVCMPHKDLLTLYDKWTFNQLLVTLELNAPASSLAGHSDRKTSVLSGDYVVKPRLSCAGQGVVFHNAEKPVAACHSTNAYLLQRQLEGTLCCTFAIVADGLCLQLVAYRSLLESGSVSVCFEQMPVPESAVSTIQSIARHFNYTGMLSFDFMQDPAGQWQAIECNPRATSGVHLMDGKAMVQALTACADSGSLTGASKGSRRQEFWSSLSTVEARLLRGKFKAAEWKYLFTTRDINWSWRDPLPFLLLTFVMWPHLWKAIKHKRPVSEMLMEDVQWRGPEQMKQMEH